MVAESSTSPFAVPLKTTAEVNQQFLTSYVGRHITFECPLLYYTLEANFGTADIVRTDSGPTWSFFCGFKLRAVGLRGGDHKGTSTCCRVSQYA